MIASTLAIAKYLLALLGWGTKQVDRAQDVKAGSDAAKLDMLKGEAGMLKDENVARERVHTEQARIADAAVDEKAKLREDPNNIFRNGR
jgi:hypothetical protein